MSRARRANEPIRNVVVPILLISAAPDTAGANLASQRKTRVLRQIHPNPRMILHELIRPFKVGKARREAESEQFVADSPQFRRKPQNSVIFLDIIAIHKLLAGLIGAILCPEPSKQS
jgi:hypothetical protein